MKCPKHSWYVHQSFSCAKQMFSRGARRDLKSGDLELASSLTQVNKEHTLTEYEHNCGSSID